MSSSAVEDAPPPTSGRGVGRRAFAPADTATYRALTESARLWRPLLLLAGSSLVLAVGVSTVAINRVYTAHLVADAKHQAVAICQAVLEYKRSMLPTSARGMGRPGDFTDAFDRRLRAFVAPFGILKVKIFANDKTVVYSTDPTVVGRKDPNNDRLSRALAGRPDSHIESKETVLDLEGERAVAVDVVETYVPIRDPAGRVIGSFEIYLDVTRYHQRIRAATTRLTLVLALILTGVLGGALLLVRRGSRRLRAAQRQLQEFATTDSLTGTFTRAEILARAYEENARLQRAGQANRHLSLVLMDLDGFKTVNDTQGHIVGDAVLREIARRARQTIREYDVVGRYGGDEFLFVLPETSLEDAAQVAERIRRAVTAVPHGTRQLGATVSLGVASSSGDESLDAIIGRADKGLYQAKQSGRNQVAWVQFG